MRGCRDITALVSRGLDKKLSFGERMAIGLHLLMCSHCRKFETQTRFIRQAAQHSTERLQNRGNGKP